VSIYLDHVPILAAVDDPQTAAGGENSKDKDLTPMFLWTH
jgi:hypothetical protein